MALHVQSDLCLGLVVDDDSGIIRQGDCWQYVVCDTLQKKKNKVVCNHARIQREPIYEHADHALKIPNVFVSVSS